MSSCPWPYRGWSRAVNWASCSLAQLTGSTTGSLASSSAFRTCLQSINRAFSNTEGPIHRGIFLSKSASLGQLLIRDCLWTRFSVHQQGRLHYKWDDTVRNLSFQVDFCLQKWNKMNKFRPQFGRHRTSRISLLFPIKIKFCSSKPLPHLNHGRGNSSITYIYLK